MGKKGRSICEICNCSRDCSDFLENKKMEDDGFTICIVDCEKFKK